MLFLVLPDLPVQADRDFPLYSLACSHSKSGGGEPSSKRKRQWWPELSFFHAFILLPGSTSSQGGYSGSHGLVTDAHTVTQGSSG